MIRPTRTLLLYHVKRYSSGGNSIGSNINNSGNAILSGAITDKSQLRQLMQDKTWSIKQLLKDRTIKVHHSHSDHDDFAMQDKPQSEQRDDAVDVTDDLIIKIIGLSGFIAPSVNSTQFEQLRRAFKLQKTFIEHLYDEAEAEADAVGPRNGVSASTGSGNDVQFRLVASDHLPINPTTLTQLLKSINELSSQVDSEKGEYGFDLRTLRRNV
ncbi:hypothetical protein CANMA_002009 [Candida margitis]|uniref:uncharacterized protein n=1 Tax=Candida margitis TaxID=1775924 RepID=UPI002225DF54|nr:uncharacterized protein CANMA_002009 [Candida margitis]KAI5969013.1 hypothetical protein CANMA_002009 [Candida margitis]